MNPEQIGANSLSFCQGLIGAPASDGGVMTTEKDIGDSPSAKLNGPSVLREFEEACGMAIIGGTFGVSEGAREEPYDGIHDHGGGDGSVGEDIIADRQFAIDEMIDDSLVDAFVVT